MLKKDYGIDAPIYLKYWCINYELSDGGYAYIKAKDEDLSKYLKDKVTTQTVAFFTKLAARVGRVRRLLVEHPETTQHRALLKLVNSISVVRHQRIPVFTLNDGNAIDFHMVKMEYDLKVGPIGKQGLFNLTPTRITPSFPFYPPLTRRCPPNATVLSIVSKYCFQEYPMVPKRCWDFWVALRASPLKIIEESCCCGACPRSDKCEGWSDQCIFYQKYNPHLKTSEQSPLWFIFNSMVSGTSVDQVCTTLSLMERVDGFKPNIEVKYLIAAVLTYMKEVGPLPYKAETLVADIHKVPVHNQQSGGFSLYETGTVECEDEIIDFVWDASQENAQFPSMLTAVSLMNKLIDNVRAGGTYNPYMWPFILSKLAVKAEIKAPGSNPLKCRIFFIVPYLKFIFDFLVLNEGMRHTYGTNGVAIGMKWRCGDAERLARKHHAYEKGFFHIEADAEKLDQSLLAAILVVVFSLPFFFQRGDVDSEWKEVLRQLAAFVVGGCAVKLVKWIGHQALWVVGIMFSGMLGTSWGDSTYIVLILHCFDQFVYAKMKEEDPELAKNFRRDFRLFAKDVYGDDMFLTYPVKYWKFIVGDVPVENCVDLSNLSNYMKRASGVAIKPSESFIYVEDKTGYGPFFSGVSDDGMLVHPGPKFLQRRFVNAVVNGEQMAMPWRLKTDYFNKCAYTFTDYSIDFYWIIKWRSLQLDTMGTNAKAYDFLQFLQDETMKLYAWETDSLDRMIQDWVRELLDKGEDRDSDGIRRLKKLGIASSYYGRHFDRLEIAGLFAYDDAVQEMRANSNRLKFYNKDGTYSRISRRLHTANMSLDMSFFCPSDD